MGRTLLALALLAAQDKPEPKPGLVGEYFDLGEELNDFPNLKDMKPALRKIDRQIEFLQTNGQFARSGLIDYFYVRWTGVIRIPRTARYLFATESDDGSRVFIDGKLVVDNGGNHIPEEKTGEVVLAEGDHALRVDYFENDGGAGCIFKWASGGLRSEVVPAGVLFHAKDPHLDR